jgi:hypothetical protein
MEWCRRRTSGWSIARRVAGQACVAVFRHKVLGHVVSSIEEGNVAQSNAHLFDTEQLPCPKFRYRLFGHSRQAILELIASEPADSSVVALPFNAVSGSRVPKWRPRLCSSASGQDALRPWPIKRVSLSASRPRSCLTLINELLGRCEIIPAFD